MAEPAVGWDEGLANAGCPSSGAGEARASADSTCWPVIEGAAAGDRGDRDLFVRLYSPVVSAYLEARWRGAPAYLQELENASQDVFVECFKQGGALEHSQPTHPGGFRAFLRGVIRHVAQRTEARLRRGERQAPTDEVLSSVPQKDEELGEVFDRAWAAALIREARRRLTERARQQGEAALARVELLRLRFQEGLPVREIARRRGVEAKVVQADYERARQWFQAALLEVVELERPGEGRQALAELLQALGCKAPWGPGPSEGEAAP
jgi:RNA polymerase sigma-70 factor (ECF subfamily)